MRALKTNIKFIKLGWPGESVREFNQLHRPQLQVPLRRRIALFSALPTGPMTSTSARSSKCWRTCSAWYGGPRTRYT